MYQILEQLTFVMGEGKSQWDEEQSVKKVCL